MNWLTNIFSSGVDKVVDSVSKGLDNLFTSDEEKLILKNELQKAMNDLEIDVEKEVTSRIQAQRDIIIAEAQGESWLQRNWRPITLLCFTFILMNHYIFVPYFLAYGWPVPVTVMPDSLFSLIEVGLSGYILTVGGKKMIESSKWAKDS